MHSGYKTITPIQFANALAALAQGTITGHGLRVYLAAFALIAVREAARRYRRKRGEAPKKQSRYTESEFERLTRLNRAEVARSLRQLKRAGLLSFVEGEMLTQTYPSGEVRLVGLAEEARLAGCQEMRVAFQALGVSSATRVMGHFPRRGRMSLR